MASDGFAYAFMGNDALARIDVDSGFVEIVERFSAGRLAEAGGKLYVSHGSLVGRYPTFLRALGFEDIPQGTVIPAVYAGVTKADAVTSQTYYPEDGYSIDFTCESCTYDTFPRYIVRWDNEPLNDDDIIQVTFTITNTGETPMNYRYATVNNVKNYHEDLSDYAVGESRTHTFSQVKGNVQDVQIAFDGLLSPFSASITGIEFKIL